MNTRQQELYNSVYRVAAKYDLSFEEAVLELVKVCDSKFRDSLVKLVTADEKDPTVVFDKKTGQYRLATPLDKIAGIC